ncbi:hypothetical protein SAMN06272735_8520 [Streptomyces sp. TLI_55]|uniref:hypothetical protein n=1 Tax=Streptomyces sp. TLI_55 TaxID=1938861 RepID=UPI000BC78FB6|nr:hypothetical protein [Streptomyces sp. TLI_55]SNX66623.1 hypothetical protein SAMN06272735_8520 [Streptomyces sp. TLI_55]
MSYELNAVIGRFDVLRSQTAGIRETAVAPLRQRMGLVPVTTQLLGETAGLTDQDGAGPGRPSTVTSPAFEQTLSYWSRGGPIAYVEADFHGGDGYQTAAVWRNGAKAWGPAHTWDFTGPREDWPINAALALLDVVASSSERVSYHDLFLEVGLGWEQDMDGWQSAGQAARWAATYNEWHQEYLAKQERAARAVAEFEKFRRLPGVPVALDGKAIMGLLALPPGPLVGAATRYLQDLHLEHGPLSREEAVARLRAWAAEQDTGCRGR